MNRSYFNIQGLVLMCVLMASGPGLAASEASVSDKKSGCKVFKPNIQPNESVSWDGRCVDGMADGVGTAQWSIGDKPTVSFTGAFTQGRIQGKGTMKGAGGDRYDGDYRNGMRDGKGIYVTANGERYEGNYKSNQREGSGALTDASGHRVEGFFQSGVLVNKQPGTVTLNAPANASPSMPVNPQGIVPAASPSQPSSSTASGTVFRLIDCKGGYQGVAGLPPKTFELRTSTPSESYRRDQATGGIFPIVLEAVEFFQNACKQKPDYIPNTIWLFDNTLPTPETITTAKNDSDHYVWITHSNVMWSVRNGPAEAAKKEQEQRRVVAADQERTKQVAALRSQEAARRAAFLSKYGALDLTKVGILRSNPFSLEGKTVALSVNFYQMTGPTTGRFEVLVRSMDDRGGQIIVSNIPKGTFTEQTHAFLAAKVLGLTPLQGGEGGDPHLSFVGVVTCPESSRSCP